MTVARQGRTPQRADRRTATGDYLAAVAAWRRAEPRLAERLFRRVLAQQPRHPDALHQLGLLAQATGRLRLASRLLEASCRERPGNAAYEFDLGNLRFRQGRRGEAIRAWGRSAQLDPADEDAWRNIGQTAAEDGDLARAADAFRRVLTINPDAADVCRALAAVCTGLGRDDDARAAIRRGRALARDPDALARFAAARVQAGHVSEGVRALRRAARLRQDDVGLAYRLAGLLAYAGRAREARRACRRVLALDASHSGAVCLSAALDGHTPAARPLDDIASSFDRFAADFEEQLVNRLRYRGPIVIWRAVGRALGCPRRQPRAMAILDAGCGTGLAAPLLRPSAKRLVGIDISREMLARARARRAYDRLICGDLVAHLQATRARYDVIVAADVFVYLGDLAPVLRGARRVLRPGGLLGFSVELSDGDTYRLELTGRYTHALAYLRGVARACGFRVRHARPTTLRHERGFPVRAGVLVLQAG